MQKQEWDERQRQRSIRTLAESLRNGVREQQIQSARLYANLLDDIEEATLCFCAVQAYGEAIALARLRDREDLVETIILPHALSQASTYQHEMEEKEGKLERVVDRLQVIQKTKREAEEKEDVNGRIKAFL